MSKRRRSPGAFLLAADGFVPGGGSTMAPRKEHTPEDLAKARHLYETTSTPTARSRRCSEFRAALFSKRVRVGNWQRRRAGDGGSKPPDAAASGLTPADARAALALRIQRVAEREMDAVERILDV